MGNSFGEGCPTRVCDFNVLGDVVGCTDGSGSCFTAKMLKANVSGFHDEPLAEATERINEILDEVGHTSGDRMLAILGTRMGVFLAWVKHDHDLGYGAVTPNNTDEEISTALNLVD